jgi:hypothetical protein
MKEDLIKALNIVLFRQGMSWDFGPNLISLLGYYSPEDGLPEEIQKESERFQIMVERDIKRTFLINCLGNDNDNGMDDRKLKLLEELVEPIDQPDIVKLISYVRSRAKLSGDLEYLDK